MNAQIELPQVLKDKLPLCRGCRDDFYNRPGNTPCGHCFSLESAEVVERFRIGWWTQPISPSAYQKVVTLSCHHATGQYAQHKEMADCFPGLTRVKQESAYDARTA